MNFLSLTFGCYPVQINQQQIPNYVIIEMLINNQTTTAFEILTEVSYNYYNSIYNKL